MSENGAELTPDKPAEDPQDAVSEDVDAMDVDHEVDHEDRDQDRAQFEGEKSTLREATQIMMMMRGTP